MVTPAGLAARRLDGVTVRAGSSAVELLLHPGEHFPRRRQHAQEAEPSRLGHRLAVHEHREFAVVALGDLGLDSQRLPNPCRHPGGMKARDSVAAGANQDAAHRTPLAMTIAVVIVTEPPTTAAAMAPVAMTRSALDPGAARAASTA